MSASPMVARLGPRFDGTLCSASRPRGYVRIVLRRHPDLHVDLLGTFVGVDSVSVRRGVAHDTLSAEGLR